MKFIKAWTKILLIRPEMMGDTILLTSIISTIKKRYPGSRIYMLLQHPMEEIIKNNSDVEGYIYTKKKLSIPEFFDLTKKVKEEKFDVSIIFEDNPTPSYALLSLLAGIPNRIGDKARLLYGWMYNKGVWINSTNPTLHHIELYLKLLEPLGITDEKMPLKIIPDKEAENRISQFVPNKSQGEVFVGLHIGTGGGNRALLPETYAQISDLLQGQIKCKIFLLGAQNEEAALSKIKAVSRKPFIDLVSKLSIQQLFSVIKRMDVFVGVDSGPLHAAAAFKIPIVAIYTAKDVNPARWLPWMTKYIMVKSPPESCNIKCSHRECNYDYCLRAADAEEIVNSAVALLNHPTITALEYSE